MGQEWQRPRVASREWHIGSRKQTGGGALADGWLVCMGSGSQERRLTPERHGVQDNMGGVGDRREMGLARKV